MIINDASSNLITDSARYLLIRRSIDDDDSPGEYQAHFRVSLPLGNQGLLKLDTSENDLSPLLGSSPSRLTHKPFALWLALSFDDPDQMDGEASPPKQRERPPPTKRLRTSGSRRPSQATSNMGTRSRSGGSGRGGRGGSETSGAGDRSRTLTLNGAAELQRSSHLDVNFPLTLHARLLLGYHESC